MDLSNLRPAEGSVHSGNFRRGRGHGSGNGKTAGKGHKGQKARSGAPRPGFEGGQMPLYRRKARSGAPRPGFEGGQMPLYRRLPKRGFKNRNTKHIIAFNIHELERFEDGAVVTIESLVEKGIIGDVCDGVKALGGGELSKKLTVKLNAFSESAKAKIEAAGGTCEVI